MLHIVKLFIELGLSLAEDADVLVAVGLFDIGRGDFVGTLFVHGLHAGLAGVGVSQLGLTHLSCEFGLLLDHVDSFDFCSLLHLLDFGFVEDGSLATGLLGGLISDRAEHVLGDDSDLGVFLEGFSLS